MKKNILIQFLFAVFLLTVAVGCASTQRVQESPRAEAAPTISDIKIQDHAVVVEGNQAFTYTIYKSGDPYRLTVEIPEMRTGVFTNRIVSDKPGVTEIVPQQVDSPQLLSRLEIVLQAPSTVVPIYKDNTLTLVIKPEEQAIADPGMKEEVKVAQAPPPVEAATPAAEEQPSAAERASRLREREAAAERSSSVPKATAITRIDVEEIADGVKVNIRGNGVLVPNVFPVDGKVVVDIYDVTLSTSLPKTVVPPLKGIRAGKHKDKVRLVLDLKEKTGFDVAAAGNAIEIELRGKAASTAPRVEVAATPKVKADTAPSVEAPKAVVKEQRRETPKEPVKEITSLPPANALAEVKSVGRKISLEFQDAEVSSICKLLADYSGLNLVLNPAEVKGKITIQLKNMTWEQALDIVTKQTNLAYRIEDNTIYVAPPATFKKIVDDQATLKKSQEEAEPLHQVILRINYAKAEDVQNAITSGNLKTQRGTVTKDERMNTLIIQDTARSIEKIRELVKIMDVAKPQVMIEAKIVQVSSDYSETLGIRWGGSFTPPSFPTTVGGTFSVNTPTITAGSAATNPGGVMGLTVGYANSVKVDLSLQALESIKKAKTLSNPKVLTMDNQKAQIQQGSTFFISTVSQAGTQTQQQQATLSLEVTPKIAPDGYVQISVKATDNALVSVNPPVVDTKSLDTNALIKTGETLVLGGIYTSSKTEDETGVPLVSKIPVLGWLFKTKNTTGPTIKELLIFITPTIVTRPQAL